MRKEDIQSEADELLADHGEAAYETARAAMREARNRGDWGLEKFFAQVAVRIADRTGKEIGVDTGTRYVSH